MILKRFIGCVNTFWLQHLRGQRDALPALGPNVHLLHVTPLETTCPELSSCHAELFPAYGGSATPCLLFPAGRLLRLQKQRPPGDAGRSVAADGQAGTTTLASFIPKAPCDLRNLPRKVPGVRTRVATLNYDWRRALGPCRTCEP